MRLFKLLMCGVLGICLAGWVAAAPTTFHVTVDTTSIDGTSGALDFNFNPGPLTVQSASLQILNFSSDGTSSASPSLTGDVTGALPATLTFDNGAGFNDYFEVFTFGTSVAFDVSLFGPALSSPDGLSTSGSKFAFSMFSNAAGTLPVLTTNTAEGFAYTVDVNLDGSAMAASFLASGPGTVPEPGSLMLMSTGLAAWSLSRRRRYPRRGGNVA